MRLIKIILSITVATTLSSCASVSPRNSPTTIKPSEVTPLSLSGQVLRELPKPAGKILVSVYDFRDRTGQYKQSPSNAYSTVVTQGTSAFLMKGLLDSGWFTPLEREGLNNLLTERKLHNKQQNKRQLGSLLASPILLEGGVIAYDSNIRTGGIGAEYLGVGASSKYREDQVTVNLRMVDIQTGEILHSVSSTKSVFSRKVDSLLFKFVRFKELAEFEAGFSYNEPAQLCVTDAIESALIQLITKGIVAGSWALEKPQEIRNPVFRKYLNKSDLASANAALAAIPKNISSSKRSVESNDLPKHIIKESEQDNTRTEMMRYIPKIPIWVTVNEKTNSLD